MILVDTNVVSEAMSARPDPLVVSWLNAQAAETLYLPSVALAELLFGVGAQPEGGRKARLTAALDGLLALFPGRVLAFDQESARRYADMAVAARAAGRTLSVADGYIAGTAASRGFAIATRDTRHFQDTGVQIIDPWQPS